jgi:hypothetical protein
MKEIDPKATLYELTETYPELDVLAVLAEHGFAVRSDQAAES